MNNQIQNSVLSKGNRLENNIFTHCLDHKSVGLIYFIAKSKNISQSHAGRFLHKRYTKDSTDEYSVFSAT